MFKSSEGTDRISEEMVKHKQEEYITQKKKYEDLKKSFNQLRDKNFLVKEKLERQIERIEHRQQELAERRRQQKDIIANESKKSNKKNVQRVDVEKLKELEIENLIKSKMLELISQRAAIDEDPLELFYEEATRYEGKANVIITTVKIKYFEPEEQDSNKEVHKKKPYEVAFRIQENTKFKDIKDQACKFWYLEEPEKYFLLTSAFVSLDNKLDQLADNYLMKNSIYPELWLIPKNQLGHKVRNSPYEYSNLYLS